MIKYPLYRYNMEMARATQSFRALPALAADQLQKLGRDISIARKRRRMSLSEMAERMMVNIKTVQRLEKGDPSVGVGFVATPLWFLVLHRPITPLVPPTTYPIRLQQHIL